MEEHIIKEIKDSIAVGEKQSFSSTFNGGGYDWSHLNVFSESNRDVMVNWLEEVSTSGYTVEDVTLHRTSEDQLAFSIYASQISPAWYSGSILSFSKLSEGISLEQHFGEDVDEIRVLFYYLYQHDGVTFKLAPSDCAMILSDDEERFLSKEKLPVEFIEQFKGFLDAFSKRRSSPEGFELNQIEISCDDIDSEDITVYESWHQTYLFNV